MGWPAVLIGRALTTLKGGHDLSGYMDGSWLQEETPFPH